MRNPFRKIKVTPVSSASVDCTACRARMYARTILIVAAVIVGREIAPALIGLI